MTVTLPKHVAIVMDGNGRWAKKRKMPRLAGHHAGVKSARRIVECAAKEGIRTLTLFAFSSENWSRPANEVNSLMNLLSKSLDSEVPKLHDNHIRLSVIGDRSRFDETLQTTIDHAEKLTANNTGMHLLVAINYGGRWDITHAAKQLAQAVEEGKLSVDDITEDTFANFTATAGVADPDLYIRTAGESRISNFLLWQFAYTELYFTEKYWPEFKEDDFKAALNDFSQRKRRFGLTDDQLEVA